MSDIKSATVLKNTNKGQIVEAETIGGLHIIFLKKSSGEMEVLSSSTSSLRSQAIANKKRPDLDIPVIVKSAEKSSIILDNVLFKSAESKNKEKTNNLHALATAATLQAAGKGTYELHQKAVQAHYNAADHHAYLAAHAESASRIEKHHNNTESAEKLDNVAKQHRFKESMHLSSMRQHGQAAEKIKHGTAETKTKSSEFPSAKQQLGKILASKIQNKSLGEEEQTKKIDTIATQKAVKRNKIKTGTGGFSKKPSYTPPPSEEATAKLPKVGK